MVRKFFVGKFNARDRTVFEKYRALDRARWKNIAQLACCIMPTKKRGMLVRYCCARGTRNSQDRYAFSISRLADAIACDGIAEDNCPGNPSVLLKYLHSATLTVNIIP